MTDVRCAAARTELKFAQMRVIRCPCPVSLLFLWDWRAGEASYKIPHVLLQYMLASRAFIAMRKTTVLQY